MSSSSSTQATAIPGNRSKSFSTPGHSPKLLTPTSTPPNFAEQRLQQILMNCEAGTHSFHRGDGDDYDPSHGQGIGTVPGPAGPGPSGDLRRKSFAAGEALPGKPNGRRPSFLSSLSLSRPFGFTPSQPSSPAAHPHLPHGLAMTSSSPNSIASSPVTQESEIHRAKSTPPQPPQLKPLQTKPANHGEAANEVGAIGMQRSKTAPNTPVKVAGGFRPGGFSMTQQAEEKRHFDPSREPKLLGLL